jgi:EAL domain-containing protein (putative c-di-GMP-specific phosphodiesterase class I)
MDEAATLLDIGVDYAQGYLFGRPAAVSAPSLTRGRRDGSDG